MTGILNGISAYAQQQIAAYATHTGTAAFSTYISTLPIGIVLTIVGVVLLIVGSLGRWAQLIGGVLIIVSVLIYAGVIP